MVSHRRSPLIFDFVEQGIDFRTPDFVYRAFAELRKDQSFKGRVALRSSAELGSSRLPIWWFPAPVPVRMEAQYVSGVRDPWLKT
jgi:hypothetical protein